MGISFACLLSWLLSRFNMCRKGEKGVSILSFCFRSNSSREDFGPMQNLSKLLWCLFRFDATLNSASKRKKTSETPPSMGLMLPYLELLQPFIPFSIYTPFYPQTSATAKHFSFNTCNLFAIFSPVWPMSCTCQSSFPLNLSKHQTALTTSRRQFFFTLRRPIRV